MQHNSEKNRIIIKRIIRKAINEMLNREGVADKYLDNKFIIPDEEKEFEKKYMMYKTSKDNVFFSKGDWKIIKNPVSLESFGPNVRGVITEKGDLYIENFSEGIHHDIIKLLFKKGIISGKFTKSWSKNTPFENHFLTVQRKNNSNVIAVGESNKRMYKESEWELLKSEIDVFINKAKEKNQNIVFTNKLVGIKFNVLKTQSKLNRITEINKNKNIYCL